MAEYNPSKIIKDGNTYNFRDTTKIPLAGSNAISGSLIPSTNGTVNLGSPSYQWNQAYIKSLTINGVACGDILTHNASEFVDVSSNQTVNGQKIFTVSPRVTRTSPDIALNISDCDVTEIPTEAKFASLYFRDKNNKNLAYIAGQQRINGTKRLCLRTHRTDNINNYYSVDLDSDGDFYPEKNNAMNLGTSALKWKSLNGINPGALSLPSSTYINVDTTNWDVAGGTNVYTPPANGWLHIRVAGATELMVRWSGWRFGDRRVSTTATDLGVTIPVVAGVTVDVVTVASGFEGKCQFFPCQGNVQGD